jgi:hypothetical protein
MIIKGRRQPALIVTNPASRAGFVFLPHDVSFYDSEGNKSTIRCPLYHDVWLTVLSAA